MNDDTAPSAVVPVVAKDRFARSFGWSAALCGLLILGGEFWRWSDPDRRLFALFGVLCGEQPDWLPFVPLFALLPLLQWRWPLSAGEAVESPAPDRGSVRVAWIAALTVGVIAFAVSHWLNLEFTGGDRGTWPPAYHDEYSYLLQAETFLQGRTGLPELGPRPELFQQMHVLNEGLFASRYFPGVGAWLAPFVALGDPWMAQQVAHALCAVLVFWIGRDLRDNLCGFIAGLLFGVSPGLAIFSTLLLAHHPTLLGLLLFVWAFLRMKRGIGDRGERSLDGSRLNGSRLNQQVGYAVVAGAGLSFAMLSRPMTAAGVGLPFGIWFGWWLLTGGSKSNSALVNSPRVQRVKLAVTLTLPLVAGIGCLLWYSWTITGDPLVSPYQQYTEIYTPRHVYGFNNVVRGEQHLGPKVIDNYDRWAENLTPALAARNVRARSIASLRLSLGVVPLVFSLLFLLIGRRLRGDLWLVVAAIVSLHVVHVPYWYAGIMDWHYVLESAPFWLLLCGAASSNLIGGCRNCGTRWPGVWWPGVLLIAVLANTATIPLTSSDGGTWSLWRGRVPQMLPEFRFARGTYAHVAAQIDELRGGQPAVVLVLPDASDRSLDFVTNRPSESVDVLRVRVPAREQTRAGLGEIAALFPERLPLVLDAATRVVSPLRP